MNRDKLHTILDELKSQKLDHGLYVVATDIGNNADITLRALAVLEQVDFVICEERKEGSKLLNKYGIDKPLETLNEHNEKEQSKALTDRFISEKVTAALISDGGTPLFADPGKYLIEQCRFFNIPVIVVPGASSLMAVLMLSGISQGSGQFLYYGFLPANKEERIKKLFALRANKRMNMVFLETPYRMNQLLRDMNRVLGSGRKGLIGYKLTTPDEKILTGNLAELVIMTKDLPKGEFVLVLYADRPRNRRK